MASPTGREGSLPPVDSSLSSSSPSPQNHLNTTVSSQSLNDSSSKVSSPLLREVGLLSTESAPLTDQQEKREERIQGNVSPHPIQHFVTKQDNSDTLQPASSSQQQPQPQQQQQPQQPPQQIYPPMTAHLQTNGAEVSVRPEVAATDLGTRLKLMGKVKEGMAKYAEAIRINSNYAPAYYNIAVVYSENRNFDEAIRFYKMAIERNPAYIEAYCNLGVIYKNAGRLELAIQFYQKALSLDPNFLIAKNNLAIALTDMGTHVKNQGNLKIGIQYYKKALVYNVQYADAYYNLGVAYGEQSRFDRAIFYYQLAIFANPMCCEAYNNLGVIMKDSDNLPRAIECYKNALEINPKFSQALNNIAVVYTIQGKLDEAFHHVKLALSIDPNYAEAYNNLGVLYRDEGRIDRAILCYEQCIRLNPLSHDAGQNRLLALNYLPNRTLDGVYQSHKEWGQLFENQFQQQTSWPDRPPKNQERKIRIGYISPDFFTHSVSYFAEALLRHANKEAFEVFCYSNVVKEDRKTVILKSLVDGDKWRSIFGKNGQTVAELVNEDKIDILVELTGHTAGNRLDVMARKPAPIQATMIGYPNTTGMTAINYRISDLVADPLETKQNYVENLIRLSCFLCYTPAPDPLPVLPAPCETNNFITFGSFNNLAKITSDVLALWAKVLKSVPTSKFLLKCKPFVNQKSREKILLDFEQLGISSSRITLMGLIPSNSDHMRTYNLMDISLDTWPYAGTTTTCESLFMGVPVVSLRGESHAQNVGASLLTAIGHRELIASSPDNYVEIAVNLSKNPAYLANLRKEIRSNMEASLLMDGAGYMKELEEAFLSMISNYHSKE